MQAPVKIIGQNNSSMLTSGVALVFSFENFEILKNVES